MLQSPRFMILVLVWSVLSLPAQADLAGLTTQEVRQLARQGEPAAQVELGLIYQYGEGLPKEPAKALTWYCRAAYQGSVSGQRNLAWMFLNGQGVPRDEGVAVHWFKQAAAGGDEYSRRILERLDGSLDGAENGCAHVARPAWLEQRCRKTHCRKIVGTVERLAPEFGLDSDLVLAVIAAESSFKIHACSGKHACGLMQLIPVTAKRFGVRDIGDLEQNLRGGMAYLQWLLAYFQGNLPYALAGYNAGEGAVVKYRGVPPYPETRAYVQRIIEDYGKTRHAYRKNWVTPSRIMARSVAGLSTARAASVL